MRVFDFQIFWFGGNFAAKLIESEVYLNFLQSEEFLSFQLILKVDSSLG